MKQACENCKQRKATVHVTDIRGSLSGGASPDELGAPGSPDTQKEPTLRHRHLCDPCAAKLKLPHMAGVPKNIPEIWKLLQQSARRAREQGGLACSECGLTMSEFRGKGRLGCPRCYEVFEPHLAQLFLRVHNASEHVGRMPGMDERELERRKQLSDLQEKLAKAIRGEAYENAARLRDEIQSLQDDHA